MLVPSPGMISLPSLRVVSHSFPVSLFPCPHQVGGRILNGASKGVELSPGAPGWLNLDLLVLYEYHVEGMGQIDCLEDSGDC